MGDLLSSFAHIYKILPHDVNLKGAKPPIRGIRIFFQVIMFTKMVKPIYQCCYKVGLLVLLFSCIMELLLGGSK